MNIGMIVCLIMAGLFCILAIIFTLLKDKGAMLISGFNTLPKEEREQFDTEKMSRDQRNAFLIWSAVFIVGGVAAYYLSYYAAVAALIVWLILFFKDVQLDTEKAFGKYRK